MRWAVRALVPFGLLPGLVLASVLAPEHVHEGDADHAQTIVHRHFASHHHDNAEADHHASELVDHAPIAISDRDDYVVWLDDVGIQPATHGTTTPAAILVDASGPLYPPSRWAATAAYDTAPPHGPPKQFHALRGPPAPAYLT